MDVLDLTLLRRFDALVFSRLEEYSFAIAELVLRSLPSIRLYATDELWKNFFTGEEVTFLHDWRDYQVLRDESTCFIDSDEAIQPGYKEGTKCRRYNSVNVMMSILWACNVEKLGDENPQEKILLLDYATESAGLVDIIQFTYVYAHMARERGWVPVVLLDKKPNQYLGKNGENMWDYFFRRVHSSLQRMHCAAHKLYVQVQTI